MPVVREKLDLHASWGNPVVHEPRESRLEEFLIIGQRLISVVFSEMCCWGLDLYAKPCSSLSARCDEGRLITNVGHSDLDSISDGLI